MRSTRSFGRFAHGWLGATEIVVIGLMISCPAAHAADDCWIDAKTGAKVPTRTIPARLGVDAYRNYVEGPDKEHAYQSGQNFVLVPCPPPSTPSTTGVRTQPPRVYTPPQIRDPSGGGSVSSGGG